MIIEQESGISGKWAKATELGSVRAARIVSEAKPAPSKFTDEKTGLVKTELVAKVQFQGIREPLNVRINRATKNGLIAAFGNDSINWQNRTLAVLTEKGKVSGRNATFLFLIPEGFVKSEDDGGYDVIIPEAEAQAKADILPPFEGEQENIVTPF
jgi:hypothetical protein